MTESNVSVALMPIQDDNDPGFYAPPEGAMDPGLSGYGSNFGTLNNPNSFFIRITPAQVEIPKGAPVDFTLHIKACRDFDSSHPLVVRLLPTLGRGSAIFAQPDTAAVSGRVAVEGDGERLVIIMKKTDEAARVIVHTEYPPDWWGGSTKVQLEAGQSTPVDSVQANVIVSDRVPAAWRRLP